MKKKPELLVDNENDQNKANREILKGEKRKVIKAPKIEIPDIKTILVLQGPTGFIEFYDKNNINKLGYEIIECHCINDFINRLECYKDKIGLIVTETNMSPADVSEEFSIKSQGGLMTGFNLLTDIVYTNTDYEDIPSIIYTPFTDSIEKYIDSIDNQDELLRIRELLSSHITVLNRKYLLQEDEDNLLFNTIKKLFKEQKRKQKKI